jgi:hypothetical protein
MTFYKVLEENKIKSLQEAVKVSTLLNNLENKSGLLKDIQAGPITVDGFKLAKLEDVDKIAKKLSIINTKIIDKVKELVKARNSNIPNPNLDPNKEWDKFGKAVKFSKKRPKQS